VEIKNKALELRIFRIRIDFFKSENKILNFINIIKNFKLNKTSLLNLTHVLDGLDEITLQRISLKNHSKLLVSLVSRRVGGIECHLKPADYVVGGL
jgi:hypothetical protein